MAAVLILITITVFITVILYYWIVPFTNVSITNKEAINEKLKIEAIKVELAHNCVYAIKLYVRNIGSSLVRIGDVYLLKGQKVVCRCALLKNEYVLRLVISAV